MSIHYWTLAFSAATCVKIVGMMSSIARSQPSCCMLALLVHGWVSDLQATSAHLRRFVDRRR